MKITSLLLFAIVTSLLACSSSDKKEKEEEPKEAKKEEKKIEWGYSGAFGPKFWGDLDPKFLLCKEGEHQSPIDLIWKKPVQQNPLTLMYNKAQATVIDSGHDIRVNLKGDNSVKMRNSVYNLEGIHFHSPSEHQFSGKSFPAEIHFVHKNDENYYAVIGVVVKEGKSNPVADSILKNLPSAKNAEQKVEGNIDISGLIPEVHTLYNYAGSLTMPPCTEGVNWIVYNTPIEFSVEQLETLENRYPMNNRPLQPLNDRAMVNYEDIEQ